MIRSKQEIVARGALVLAAFAPGWLEGATGTGSLRDRVSQSARTAPTLASPDLNQFDPVQKLFFGAGVAIPSKVSLS